MLRSPINKRGEEDPFFLVVLASGEIRGCKSIYRLKRSLVGERTKERIGNVVSKT